LLLAKVLIESGPLSTAVISADVFWSDPDLADRIIIA
jgi:hypothetical protein